MKDMLSRKIYQIPRENYPKEMNRVNFSRNSYSESSLLSSVSQRQ